MGWVVVVVVGWGGSFRCANGWPGPGRLSMQRYPARPPPPGFPPDVQQLKPADLNQDCRCAKVTWSRSGGYECSYLGAGWWLAGWSGGLAYRSALIRIGYGPAGAGWCWQQHAGAFGRSGPVGWWLARSAPERQALAAEPRGCFGSVSELKIQWGFVLRSPPIRTLIAPNLYIHILFGHFAHPQFAHSLPFGSHNSSWGPGFVTFGHGVIFFPFAVIYFHPGVGVLPGG